jgi:lysophospholipase L1-like esterase
MSLPKPVHLKLTISALATVLMLSACSSSSKKPTAVPNPFNADGTGSSNNIQINTLRAFGDSYTAEDYSSSRGTKNWTRELAALVPTGNIENYAIGRAQAQSGDYNSFGEQVSNWQRRGSASSSKDLSVVYFGYNDVGRFGKSEASYAASRAHYRDGVDRLVQSGASAGNNRIFVTQIHDWSRNPGVNNASTSQAIKDWVNFVGDVANSHPNVIAVDLYTVFNRVMENPGAFGLVNVSDANSSRSAKDFLFHDDIHFGSRGQELIARTYRHYLTRGWDWANALSAGSSASNQLSKDIEAGALNFGNGKSINSSVRLLPLTSKVKATAPIGLAFDIKTAPILGQSNGRIGLAYGETAKNTIRSSSSLTTDVQSTASSVYWLQPSGGFFYTAQLTQNRHRFEQRGHDDLLRSAVLNHRSANSLGFETALRYSFDLGRSTWTPWVSLSQQQHTLHAGTDRSLYTSDVSYRQSKVSDTYSGIGLDFELSQLPLRGGHRLVMGGGINHLRALQRDALRLQSSEAINGILSTEVIERGFEPRTQLSLNADLVLKQEYQFGLTYRVEPEQRSSSQALELKAKIPF